MIVCFISIGDCNCIGEHSRAFVFVHMYIDSKTFIYLQFTCDSAERQIKWKSLKERNFFQYFDGTLNTLQFRSDSNIFNLWQSVVICEWAMSLKIHEKKCDWNIVAAYVKMQWKKGVVSNTCLAWQKLQVDWKLSFTEPEKRTTGQSKIQQLFKIVWIFQIFFSFFHGIDLL